MADPHFKILAEARELDLSGARAAAQEAYEGYLALEPGSAEGWADYGGFLMASGRLPEAKEAGAHALDLDPTCLSARINAACALMQEGHLAEAEGEFRQILVLEPGRADVGLGLAGCLFKQEAYDQARALLGTILDQDPGNLPAHQLLGQIFHRLGLWSEYGREIKRRLEVQPTCAYAEFEQSFLCLLFGDLPEGWRRYEARLRVPRLAQPGRNFSQPRWNGENFAGKTLLLHYEQGFGDTVMFVRFAPAVKALGGTVLLQAQPELAELVATCPGIDAVIAYGEPLPDFDLQLSLLSLPALFRTDLGSIPAEIPYLDIPERVPNRDWIGKLLAAAQRCTRIGLVWSGSAAHQNDKARSIPAAALEPFAGLPNVFWYGLQPGMEDKAPLPSFVSLAPWLSNFSDTAYALSGMDLVITVDTALAHLSGALGIPTFLLLPYSPDWRWLLGREDSPWYPSMRIYRQPAPGDWAGAIRMAAADLSAPA